MYIHRVYLHTIRSIARLSIAFDPDAYAGWHVVLGENGSGKSTLVRAIALALSGPNEAAALRQNWNDWLPPDQHLGLIRVLIDHDPTIDKATGKGRLSKDSYITARLQLRSSQSSVGRTTELVAGPHATPDPFRHIWGTGTGWFSASYGPFRRFTGGDKSFEKLFYTNRRLAAHLSAFGEDVALTECLSWLISLRIKQLENRPEGDLLTHVTSFVNDSGLLPHGTALDRVTSDSVTFKDGYGQIVAAPQLSDGFRSVLSLTFELIRQLSVTYGQNAICSAIRTGRKAIALPGVVLIDEVDAHLHPTWQQRIGTWFTSAFPEIQFIVTTHSPIVCQAAACGSVWRLPSPGQGGEPYRVKGDEFNRLVYGSVLDAYDTNLFGESVTRSDASRAKLARLAELNLREAEGNLSALQRVELKHLRAMLPSDANTLNS